MRIRRRLPVITVVLLAIAAVALAVVLRKHAPPEPARLLPSADAFVYANLSWMRRASLTGEIPPVAHDPDYEQFIQATGFQFERDLEQAAFAVHYPSPGGLRENRFSEVLVGKVDGERLKAYLQKLASGVESYAGRNIYDIPLEGRTLRVCMLGVDTVAASNHPDPQIIRGIIDRSRKLASPFGGPLLLRQYYKHVPLASAAWGIFEANSNSSNLGSSSSGGTSLAPMDWSFLFSQPAVVVASVRYLGSVRLRAEAFTVSEAEATHVATQLSTFLDLFHTAEASVGTPAPDADMTAFLSSLKVDQKGDRAELTASLPPGLLRKIVAEAPEAATTKEAPAPSPAPPEAKARKHR
jgi:hypothetical protein